jgi:hypothetical protein
VTTLDKAHAEVKEATQEYADVKENTRAVKVRRIRKYATDHPEEGPTDISRAFGVPYRFVKRALEGLKR